MAAAFRVIRSWPMRATIMSPAARLAQLRRARGWSQAALAGRCGVSRAEISAIETGRLVPSVATALRVAGALGEPVEAVFAAQEPSWRWAWLPPSAADGRVWQAAVGRSTLLYPLEPTAAGVLPHDGWWHEGRLHAREEASAPADTLVIAGCDPMAGLLARELWVRHAVRVLPLPRSSARALALLRQRLVHVAGVHVTDAAGCSTNGRLARETLGPGYRLAHQVRWEAGIAVVPGRRERTAGALLRANVRWVNREVGSAARDAFDGLLASRRRPRGYDRVVHDHRAVAVTVASGWAEAGICVRPAAAEARLPFIPLRHEAYELCFAEGDADDPRMRALVATLQSPAYRRLVGDVPGCTARETGDVRSVT
jgi:molybdate-binding protein/transcriptional regulator with XRE-family HTH domain